jgi:long-chain acyl-CoA synthetase
MTDTIGPDETWIPRAELPLQRIYANERERASKIFLTQPLPGAVREWTWSEAMSDTRRVAAYLKAQNWPPGSRIAILSKNCAWWIMADFAIWMAGHASVPIFPSLSDAAIGAILEQSEPVACFLGLLDRAPAVEGTPLARLARIAFPGSPSSGGPGSEGTIGWEELLEREQPLAASPVREPGEIATIIYTSGTTGEPKGAMQTFLSLALMAQSMLPALKTTGVTEDRILSYLPLAHIAERAIVEANCLYLPLQIFFVASQASFLDDLRRAQPTIFFTVPRLLIRFQQGVWEKIPPRRLALLLRIPIVRGAIGRRVLKALALDTVRLAASGSAPLPVEVLAWYRSLGLNLVEGYGMTETGITHVPLPGKMRAGYVGQASPYADTRIAKDGEVEIKGPMNLAGYYRNPSLTEACFTPDGYFRTGDRGEIDSEGRLRIVGRLKEEFKTSKGKYVIPAQIEKELERSGLFASVCVLGAGRTGPFAMAVLAPEKQALSESNRNAVEEDLKAELRRVNQRLEHYEQLRFLVIAQQPWTVDNGLLTPTLKVRRARIETIFTSSFDAWERSANTIVWLDSVPQPDPPSHSPSGLPSHPPSAPPSHPSSAPPSHQ